MIFIKVGKSTLDLRINLQKIIKIVFKAIVKASIEIRIVSFIGERN